MPNEKENSSPKLQIILAIVGLVGTLGVAYLTNIDKVRGTDDSTKESEFSEAKNPSEEQEKNTDSSVTFSGNNNDNNQVITGGRVENNTTNIFEERELATKAPANIIKTLSPGTSIEKAKEIFGEPDRKDGNVFVYNQLENLYIRLVVDSSSTICSATFQRKDESSVFQMYPIDIFSLGESSFFNVFEQVGTPDIPNLESGGTPKGGDYSSITEYFGAAGQYLTYTFGISKYLNGVELEQLPSFNEKIDFLTVTGDECPDAVYSGLRWDEYL